MPFSKSVNFILTWTFSFLNVIKPLKRLQLARGSLLSFTAAENSQSKWITSVFNKNVNICLRCEQKTLNFNNEMIKSVGVEKDRVWSLWSSCHSAPDSKSGERGGRETGEGEGDRERVRKREIFRAYKSTERKACRGPWMLTPHFAKWGWEDSKSNFSYLTIISNAVLVIFFPRVRGACMCFSDSDMLSLENSFWTFAALMKQEPSEISFFFFNFSIL